MDVGRILDATQDAGLAGLGITWVIVQGILLWSVVGLLLAVGLHFGVARLGWLDARGQRRRWARITFATTMLLVFAPAAGGVGLVTQVRNKVSALMLEQLAKKGASQAIGSLLLLPTMISHDLLGQLGPRRPVASRPTSAPASAPAAKPRQEAGNKTVGKRVRSLLGRMATRFVGEERKPERTGPDVTFLLKIERRGLLGTLAGEAAREALRKAPLYVELRKQSAVAGLVADLAVDLVSRQADKKIAIYTDLFAGLKAGEDGKLFHSEAAQHLGQRFFEKTFIPYVEAPFDALRIKLILLALLWPLLVLGGIRLGLRRGGRGDPPPAASAVAGDG